MKTSDDAGAAHESFRAHAAIKGSSNRAFGLTVGGVLLAIGLFRGFFGAGFQTWTLPLLAVGGALAVLALVAAGALAPLNRAWTRLGLLLFKVVNPVMLFLIFVIAVVPTAFVMRWRGHDPLRLRRDAQVASYWIERQPPGPAADSLRNQF